ncbi:unnamed protein product [Owenia fusiformis]|uniref:tRNA (guanine(10)-N(2))-methyltransferase TRMT11 n=1 Tax=Owenia fusiformis TaxID=6347 RepID=A0A8S4N113_OWEFU|nr:unnamed protein product [Owenia fusiformis]
MFNNIYMKIIERPKVKVTSKMAASMSTCRKYLLHFVNEHIDFRLAELKSIVKLCGTELKYDEQSYDKKNPFLIVGLPSESCAKKIMKRAILIRSMYELWAEGNNRDQLCTNIKNIPTEQLRPYLSPDLSYRFKIETFNKTISMEDKLQRIENMPYDVLDFQGKVKLKNPDHSFHWIEYYGYANAPPTPEPTKLYFGRWIADGQRDKIREYHLQKRHFIGNTSMDAALSLIMANVGLVKENLFVFDPFVGTGSLLVAAAHNGAYVMGTDIDFQLLHAKAKPSRVKQKVRAKDESIHANLKQYGFGHLYLDALVADASNTQLWREQPLFDVIITDPPYGIREAAVKSGKKKTPNEVAEEHKEKYIPPKVQYGLSDIYKDLLNFAAKYLVLNGRLVYWLPIIRTDYSDDNVPQHPCFKLQSNCEQAMTETIGRRLITMEKVIDYQEQSDDFKATYVKDHYTKSFRERYFTNWGQPKNIEKSQTNDTTNPEHKHSEYKQPMSTDKSTIATNNESIATNNASIAKNNEPITQSGVIHKHCDLSEPIEVELQHGAIPEQH